MWNFLLWLLSLISPAPAVPPVDYVGAVAADVAYASMAPAAAPTKPKVPRSECKTCDGTGKVRTGDDQGWTKCPDCEPDTGAPTALKVKSPELGWPPRAVPSAQ